MKEQADRLRALFPEAVTEPPNTPGAYLLLIELEHVLSGTIGNRAFALPPGHYVYAGSARGPGGIAARVSRHLRRDKKPHWHVDQLALAAGEMTALAIPDGSECELVERLLANGHTSVPSPASAAAIAAPARPIC